MGPFVPLADGPRRAPGGVSVEHVHQSARTDFGLLMRCNRLSGFLDAKRKVPALAYPAARLWGEVSADCGTGIEAEVNLARRAGIETTLVDALLSGHYTLLPSAITAVSELSTAEAPRDEDAPKAREILHATWREAGLIDLCFARNGEQYHPRPSASWAVPCPAISRCFGGRPDGRVSAGTTESPAGRPAW